MRSAIIIPDSEIYKNLEDLGFSETIDEGRLMLLELMTKAGAGFYNSHTEEAYLKSFAVTKADRTPNKKGRKFMCAMIYNHSLNRADCFELMREFRV